jgi:hypothetical protein
MRIGFSGGPAAVEPLADSRATPSNGAIAYGQRLTLDGKRRDARHRARVLLGASMKVARWAAFSVFHCLLVVVTY